MAITVLFFGQLAEITGQRQLLTEAGSTDELKANLLTSYPGLGDIVMNVAVDTVIISDNVLLKSGSTVALLPPFSGG